MPDLCVICTESWAGRLEHEAEIVGETRKRYRVKLLARTMLSRRAGDVFLVPKYAVRRLTEAKK